MFRREFLGLLAAARLNRQRPPAGAVVLFDGKDLSKWVTRNGTEPGWRVADGYMEVAPGAGDIRTTQTFQDFQLHLEFWLPLMEQASGQARANSGVYLQGRYEIQVLDSYGAQPAIDGCGAIYGQAAPIRNASRRPMTWQSYDFVFRAPRGEEKGRVTVLHNAMLIHNNFELSGVTGGNIDGNEGAPGPLLLQDHGDPVRYRNIWIMSG